MARATDTVQVDIIAETKKAVANFAKMAAGITAVVLVARKLIQAVGESILLYGKQEVAERKLATAIKITGREGEISARSMYTLASELQKVTTYGDEATLSAMAMLQQLSDLSEKGLRQITPLVQDFASAMGLDLETAASLVGKTLGSSTNALTRYGVMVDMSGTQSEKLASLTQNLKDKFGGMSQELAGTTLGVIAQTKNAFGDMKEAIGEVLSDLTGPLMTKAIEFLGEVTESIEYWWSRIRNARLIGQMERLNAELMSLELLQGHAAAGTLPEGMDILAINRRVLEALEEFRVIEKEYNKLQGIEEPGNVPGLPKTKVIDATALSLSVLGKELSRMLRIAGPAYLGQGIKGMGGVSGQGGFMGLDPIIQSILSDPFGGMPIDSSALEGRLRGRFGIVPGGSSEQPRAGMSDGSLEGRLRGRFGLVPELEKETEKATVAAEQYLDVWGNIGRVMGTVANQTQDLGSKMKTIAIAILQVIGTLVPGAKPFTTLGSAFVGSFAEGGIVPRTGLAMVHGGEQVIPRGGGGGLTIVTNVHGSILSERELQGIIYNAMDRAG